MTRITVEYHGCVDHVAVCRKGLLKTLLIESVAQIPHEQPCGRTASRRTTIFFRRGTELNGRHINFARAFDVFAQTHLHLGCGDNWNSVPRLGGLTIGTASLRFRLTLPCLLRFTAPLAVSVISSSTHAGPHGRWDIMVTS